MKMQLTFTLVVTAAVLVPSLSGATSLSGVGPIPDERANPPAKAATMTKREVVKKYIEGCRKKLAKETNCDSMRKNVVEISKEALHTLGSSTNRAYMPTILKFFKSNEVELRIAAADGIGMIGPQDSDIDLLAPLTNDPVPDVRRAVAQMISHGKGSAISLLGQRTLSMRAGLTPDTPADPGKYSMPLAPESTYLYYASEATRGRLSYVVRKSLDPAMAFFKSKAKRGPLKLDEFNTLYRYQLSDEQEARERIWKQDSEAKSKQAEAMMKDPSNQQAALEKVMQIQGDMVSQSMVEQAGRYRSDLFESLTVFVLEERQIGQRSYPTRYVVLYQDKLLRMPGYQLSWMTVPDDAIKAAQTVSLVSEKEEAARTKENEALKKRAEALQNLEKKKDEQEKKNFKKGQADLEKELGF
jgi:transcription antitermination factor NusG